VTRQQLFWRAMIVVLALTGGGGLAWLAMKGQSPVLDSQGCPTSQMPPAHVDVLIDNSDPFDQASAMWATNLLKEAALDLPRYGRIRVISLGIEDPHVEFEHCSPGSPRHVDAWNQGERTVRKEWTSQLGDPIEEIATKILTRPAISRSPIIEAIGDISRDYSFVSDQGPHKIILISDLTQNSAKYSVVHRWPSWSTFEHTALASDIPELKGVLIEIHLVRRRQAPAPGQLKAFWTRWGHEAGGNVLFK